jgi:hypothetical protein
MYNWNTLNVKVCQKLGFSIPKQVCEAAAKAQPMAIEKILKLLRHTFAELSLQSEVWALSFLKKGVLCVRVLWKMSCPASTCAVMMLAHLKMLYRYGEAMILRTPASSMQPNMQGGMLEPIAALAVLAVASILSRNN